LQKAIEETQNEQNLESNQNRSLAEKMQVSEYLEGMREAMPLFHAQTLIYEEWEINLRRIWKALKKDHELGKRVAHYHTSLRCHSGKVHM
jgi:ubiquitin C-terminal hydrolase